MSHRPCSIFLFTTLSFFNIFFTIFRAHVAYTTWILPVNKNHLWNIRATVIPIVMNLLGTVPKNRNHPDDNIVKITLSRGGKTFLWEFCITGLWIIKGPNHLKSKNLVSFQVQLLFLIFVEAPADYIEQCRGSHAGRGPQFPNPWAREEESWILEKTCGHLDTREKLWISDINNNNNNNNNKKKKKKKKKKKVMVAT